VQHKNELVGVTNRFKMKIAQIAARWLVLPRHYKKGLLQIFATAPFRVKAERGFRP